MANWNNYKWHNYKWRCMPLNQLSNWNSCFFAHSPRISANCSWFSEQLTEGQIFSYLAHLTLLSARILRGYMAFYLLICKLSVALQSWIFFHKTLTLHFPSYWSISKLKCLPLGLHTKTPKQKNMSKVPSKGPWIHCFITHNVTNRIE